MKNIFFFIFFYRILDKKIDLNLFFTLSYFSYVKQATLWIPQIAVKVFINLSLRDATIKKQKKQMFGINHTATSNSYRSRNSEQRERNAILEDAIKKAESLQYKIQRMQDDSDDLTDLVETLVGSKTQNQIEMATYF